MTTQTHATKPTTERETHVEEIPTEGASEDLLAETDAMLDEIESLLDEQLIVEQEAGRFTLADAIREGSSVTNQCLGNWTSSKGETCALSAAALSIQARTA